MGHPDLRPGYVSRVPPSKIRTCQIVRKCCSASVTEKFRFQDIFVTPVYTLDAACMRCLDSLNGLGLVGSAYHPKRLREVARNFEMGMYGLGSVSNTSSPKKMCRMVRNFRNGYEHFRLFCGRVARIAHHAAIRLAQRAHAHAKS